MEKKVTDIFTIKLYKYIMTYKILKKKTPLRGCFGNIQNKRELASTFSTD